MGERQVNTNNLDTNGEIDIDFLKRSWIEFQEEFISKTIELYPEERKGLDNDN